MELGIDFAVRPISPKDSVSNFKTGNKAYLPLKTFLRKQARDFQQAMVAQTYVCIEIDSQGKESHKVIAYLTLTCSEIDLKQGYALEDCAIANQYDSLPAIKIARLAVDRRYHGHKIGSLLVDLTTAIAIDEIAPVIGCRFVVTDAKQDAVSFYHKQGFRLLDDKATEPVMFMDLLKRSRC
jgi:GNAT superfamily N-acetyltransferase